jgi:hypothetical protein
LKCLSFFSLSKSGSFYRKIISSKVFDRDLFTETVLDHFTEKSFYRFFLTERHLTETPFDRTPFDRTPFDRKAILPKHHFSERRLTEHHLTERPFDRNTI